MRQRLPSALAVCAATLAVAGCVGKSDAGQVRATLTDFRAAVAERDYGRLCRDLLAPSVLRPLERLDIDCPTALRRYLGATRQPSLQVLSVQVRGDRARARVRASAAGQKASTAIIRLVRTQGRWKITSLSG